MGEIEDQTLGRTGPASAVQDVLFGVDGPSTMVELVGLRGRIHPAATAFVFLKDGETEDGALSYGAMDQQSRAVAAALRRIGCADARVLLLYPQGLEFVVAFFGTLRAGAAAVPAPHAKAGRASIDRLLAIVDDARPLVALTTDALVAETMAALGTGPNKVIVTSISALIAQQAPDTDAELPKPDQLALVQYTSGSTGTPRGVMITHANLMANMALIREKFGHTRASVFVGWLPMFHDMGLVGNLLQPVYAGCKCVLMSPSAFLEEPVRWLRAISIYRGTTAGAPNFAYDFCVDRIDMVDRAGLDLRSLEIAFNGSEPVRARTLDRFAEAFAPYGYRRSASYPCYGMAEATLLITGGTKSMQPARHHWTNTGAALQTCISSGSALSGSGHALLIVDPDTMQPQPDGSVGEIWFAGPSVATGYWNRRPETAACFGQSPADRHDPRWLRTGDLGFMADGALYVTGRSKDVMILRGRNIYPQDIEAAAEDAHPALRPDCSAAFLIEDTDAAGKDRRALVVVSEVAHRYLREPPMAEIADAVRAVVSRDHGQSVSVIALLKPGTLPKTTSGKIQRQLCKARFVAGELSLIAEDRLGPAFWLETLANSKPELRSHAAQISLSP